jgi:hypothetical protein
MKKKQTRKLSLSKQTLTNLNEIKGGFDIQITSIGRQCSIDHTCNRMSDRDADICFRCEVLSVYADCPTNEDQNTSQIICV